MLNGANVEVLELEKSPFYQERVNGDRGWNALGKIEIDFGFRGEFFIFG